MRNTWTRKPAAYSYRKGEVGDFAVEWRYTAERANVEFDDLKDPQLQERLRNAKTPEEVLEIAQEFGMELKDDQLETVAGGAWCSDFCTEIHFCRNDGSH